MIPPLDKAGVKAEVKIAYPKTSGTGGPKIAAEKGSGRDLHLRNPVRTGHLLAHQGGGFRPPPHQPRRHQGGLQRHAQASLRSENIRPHECEKNARQARLALYKPASS